MAHIGLELVTSLVPLYEGKVHEHDGYWVDVWFEDLFTAATCIHNHYLENVARIRSDENGVSQTSFDAGVFIQFKIREDDDA